MTDKEIVEKIKSECKDYDDWIEDDSHNGLLAFWNFITGLVGYETKEDKEGNGNE